ncbi:MAG: PAS domain S-box protein [Betaproteobacteria bacterium]|nr:PAS domain S-box protein [Betaproteobacteria bacterium]
MKKTSRQEGKGRSRSRTAAEAKLAGSAAAAAAVKAETPGRLVQELRLHQADPRGVPGDSAASKRREQRLAGIIASAMDAIIAIDERHEITLVNPAAGQMFGYSEAQLLGKPISMLIPERYHGAHDAHIRNFARAKVTNRGIGRFGRIVGRRADGREFPVDASISQIEAAGERLFTVVLRDITQRIESEKALRKNYELLDRIFATTHFCIVYLDREFNFVRVNQAFAVACGYPPEFFMGKNNFDLYPGEKAEAIFRNVVATGQPFTIYAAPFRFPNHPEWGVSYWDWTLHPLRNADGAVDGLLFVLLDVTERKRAEREHAQLAAIVESSNDAILIRGPDRSILSWNAAAERLFGWSAREAVGRPIELIVPPERTGRRRRFIEGAARGESLTPVETIHLRKDGARIPTQITFSPVRDKQGKVVAHSYTVRDMSELKRKEEALRGYATRLRQLSHRLRTVEETERHEISRELHDRVGQDLSTFALILGSLGAKLPRESLRAIAKPLQDMQALLKSMVANVRDVMAELRPPVLDDYGLLAALRQLATEFAQRSGIAAELSGVELLPRLPLIVESAMYRISQEALNNIAKHAQAKKVEISLHAASGRVMLDIADDGVGFDANETSPNKQHWGLITMRERAEVVGVVFRLESAPGAGTRIALEAERAAT